MAVDAVTQGLLKDAQLSNPTIIVSSAAPVLNTDYSNYLDITALAVAANFANANITGSPIDGQVVTYRILDNGSARALSFGTNYELVGATAFPTTTTAGKRMTLAFRYSTLSSKWGMTANAIVEA